MGGLTVQKVFRISFSFLLTSAFASVKDWVCWPDLIPHAERGYKCSTGKKGRKSPRSETWVSKKLPQSPVSRVWLSRWQMTSVFRWQALTANQCSITGMYRNYPNLLRVWERGKKRNTEIWTTWFVSGSRVIDRRKVNQVLKCAAWLTPSWQQPRVLFHYFTANAHSAQPLLKTLARSVSHFASAHWNCTNQFCRLVCRSFHALVILFTGAGRLRWRRPSASLCQVRISAPVMFWIIILYFDLARCFASWKWSSK